MKFNFYTFFILFFLTPIFTFAQAGTSTASTTFFCSDKTYSCAPTLDFATSTKKYKIPKEGERITPAQANYSIFPEHLNFTSKDRNILVISRYWQTGCLYDTNGNIMHANSTTSKNTNKYLCMQTATGKKELPTELGLYNIQTKQNKDYKSTKYSTTGEITDADRKKNPGVNLGAPMAWAMHFGRIIGNMGDGDLLYNFSDGSALHERQTVNKYGSVSFVSHGCIAVEKGKGHFLQSTMNYGDLILVIEKTFPTTLDEAISINK